MRRLVVGAITAAVLAGCANSSPSASPSTTPATPDGGRPSASPREPGSSGLATTWERIGDETVVLDPLGPSDIFDLAVGPRGVLAVGQGPLGAVTWSSADGVAWTRRNVEGAPENRLLRAAPIGATWVGSGIGEGSEPGPVSTYLADSDGTWRATATFGEQRAGGIRFVALDDRVLAFAPSEFGTDLRETTDGWTWSPLDPPALQSGGVFDVAERAGALVAAGSAGIDPRVPRLWAAPDGVTWREVPLPAGASGALSVEADGAGFILVAAGAGGAARSWRSPDGADWAPWEAFHAPDGLIAFWALPDPAEPGTTYVATSLGDDESVVQHDVSVSRDGGTWSRQRLMLAPGGSRPPVGGEIADARGVGVSSAEFVYVNDVVRVGTRLVVAGSIGAEAGIWISPPAHPSAPAPAATPAAFSCPALPTDLLGMLAIPRERREECLGDRSITVTGVAIDAPAGSCRFARRDSLACRPAFILAPAAGRRVWSTVVVAGPELGAFDTSVLHDTAVTVTVRYRHPDAENCRPEGTASPDASFGDGLVAGCSRLLVATAFAPANRP